MHQIIGSVPLAGQINVWREFFDPDTDIGGKLSCKKPLTFALYLCSAGTYGVRVEKKLPKTAYVVFQVFGPMCSDGLRLYIEYGISAVHFSGSASEPAQFAQEEIDAIRFALKKHIRVKDGEWKRSGMANATETFRILGLKYPAQDSK